MNRFRLVRVALASFLLVTSFGAHAREPKVHHPAVHHLGEASSGFPVKFKPGVTEEEMVAHLGARSLGKAKRFQAPRRSPHAVIGRWRHVWLDDPKNAQALRRLKRDGLIERIEANQAVKAPDDPQLEDRVPAGQLLTLSHWRITLGCVGPHVGTCGPT